MVLFIFEVKLGLNVVLCNFEKKKFNIDKLSYNCVIKYILNILNW